ncbi:MAG: type II TA system antitoxin MqsA family protein [Anaerohalosphaeraceae bacterium]
MKKVCPICGAKALIKKTGEYRFDPPANIPGGIIVIPNSVWEECEACREVVLSPELLEKLEEQRYVRLGLLTPAEIRAIREKAGLTQAQISEKLGIGEKTYTRWESGKLLQNKSSDNLIRLFAQNPDSFDQLELQRGPLKEKRLAGYLNYKSKSCWQDKNPVSPIHKGCSIIAA